MKIALGIIVKNQRQFLEKTLPTYALMFEHRLAVDFFSDDFSREVLDEFGFFVHRQNWPGTFAGARNVLIQMAEEQGIDFLVMLDADESMSRGDLILLQNYARDYQAIILPRIEFVQDTDHFDDKLYPDWQVRAFQLKRGFYFKNKLHEMLHDKNDHPVLKFRDHTEFDKDPYKILTAPMPIYHYGKLEPDTKKLALKYINYDRIARGEDPLERLPEGYDTTGSVFWKNKAPFYGPHPLKNIGPVRADSTKSR